MSIERRIEALEQRRENIAGFVCNAKEILIARVNRIVEVERNSDLSPTQDAGNSLVGRWVRTRLREAIATGKPLSIDLGAFLEYFRE